MVQGASLVGRELQVVKGLLSCNRKTLYNVLSGEGGGAIEH